MWKSGKSLEPLLIGKNSIQYYDIYKEMIARELAFSLNIYEDIKKTNQSKKRGQRVCLKRPCWLKIFNFYKRELNYFQRKVLLRIASASWFCSVSSDFLHIS